MRDTRFDVSKKSNDASSLQYNLRRTAGVMLSKLRLGVLPKTGGPGQIVFNNSRDRSKCERIAVLSAVRSNH